MEIWGLLLGIVLAVVLRPVYKRNLELYLCILLALNFELFAFLPRLRGDDDFYNLTLVPIVILHFFELLLSNAKIGQLKVGKYGAWLFFYFVVLLLGFLIPFFDGQSLFTWVKAVKYYPLLLVYFVVVNKCIDCEKFLKYLIALSTAVVVLITLQYILWDHVTFMYVVEKKLTLRDEARGLRLDEGTYLLSPVCVMLFARYLLTKRKLVLVLFVSFLVHLTLIHQTRMFLFGILLSCVGLYIIFNRFSIRSIVSTCSVLAVIGMISIAVMSDLKSNALVSLTSSEMKNSGSSYGLRVLAYTHYLQEIAAAPFLGHGRINPSWEKSSELSLAADGIYLSDIGIVHLIYESGLLGLSWLLYGIFSIGRDVIRRPALLCISSYFLLALFVISTLDMIVSRNTMLLFGIFLGIYSNESSRLSQASYHLA